MVSLGHSHRLSLSHHHHQNSSSNAATDEPRPDSSGGDEDTTEVEPDQGNVLSHIISQLRPGADLSRVVLPTFILEPRSMLERITNFMAHPETLLPMPEVEDPVQRFVSVVKFYLSGWHIKPPGVKKPLNPILGEIYTCYWEYPDHTRGYYIAEQTSHHPPKSSYFFMAPEHHIRIDGTLKPRSKFLGNSAASMMEGIAILRFLNRGRSGRGENYIVTQPNMYARGILFGKMKYELGDHIVVRCPENNLVADIEFKTKGYFSGGYNVITGTIKNDKTQEVLYELSGTWTGEMFIKDAVTGNRELLFDARNAKPTPPTVRPIEEQDERESQRLWQKVVAALKERNHDAATDEKSRIEDRQRAEAAQRNEQGIEWKPKLFRPIRGGPGGPEEGEEGLDWILDAEIDGKTPEEQTQQILAVAPILRATEQKALLAKQPKLSNQPQKEEQPKHKAPEAVARDVDHPPPAQAAPRSSSDDNKPPPPGLALGAAPSDNNKPPPPGPALGAAPASAPAPVHSSAAAHTSSQQQQVTPPVLSKPDASQQQQQQQQPSNKPMGSAAGVGSAAGGVHAHQDAGNLIDLNDVIPVNQGLANLTIHDPHPAPVISQTRSNLVDGLQQPLIPQQAQQLQQPQASTASIPAPGPSSQAYAPPTYGPTTTTTTPPPPPQLSPQQQGSIPDPSRQAQGQRSAAVTAGTNADGHPLVRTETDDRSDEVFVDADDGLDHQV